MKKIFPVMIIALILFSFTACGEKKVEVTFDSQGGSSVTAVKLEVGEALTLPANPVKNGFVFAGWYTSENGKGTQIAAGAKPTENLNLYAYWSNGDVVQITFNSQNSTEPQTLTFASDTLITLPDTPQNNGFTFAGWFTQPNGAGEEITASTAATESKTVYAYWKQAVSGDIPQGTTGSPAQLPAAYLDVQGGSPEYNPYVAVNGKIAFPSPSKDGYTFGGWFTARNGGGTQYTSSTTISSDVRLYAYWKGASNTEPTEQETTENEKPQTAVITLYIDGSKYTSYSVNQNESHSLPAPTKDGYKFAGWYTAENGGGTRVTSSTKITADMAIYALWEKVAPAVTEYTVTFNIGEGTGSIPSEKVKEGTSISSAATGAKPTREGYKFTGWAASDGTPLSSIKITADITVYAQWEEIKTEPQE